MKLTIVTGHGQLVRAQSVSAPLVVLLQNANGQPLTNATVSWVASASTMKFANTVTDTNGYATNQWIAPPILMGWASWTAGTVTAAVPGATATFSLTAYYLDSRTSIPSVAARLLSPSLGHVLAGPSGSSANGIVQVSVLGQLGNQIAKPVPNVKVTAFSDPASPSIIQGSTLTDANGMATFTPLLGGQPGPVSPFTVDAGGLFQFPQAVQFQVTGEAPPPLPPPPPPPVPRSITLTLADESGKPLSGAAVYVLGPDAPQRATTDVSGKLVLPKGSMLLVYS